MALFPVIRNPYDKNDNMTYKISAFKRFYRRLYMIGSQNH